jgi:hypothetical protein
VCGFGEVIEDSIENELVLYVAFLLFDSHHFAFLAAVIGECELQ